MLTFANSLAAFKQQMFRQTVRPNILGRKIFKSQQYIATAQRIWTRLREFKILQLLLSAINYLQNRNITSPVTLARCTLEKSLTDILKSKNSRKSFGKFLDHWTSCYKTRIAKTNIVRDNFNVLFQYYLPCIFQPNKTQRSFRVQFTSFCEQWFSYITL